MLKRLILISIITQSTYSMITIKNRLQVILKANPKDSNNKRAKEEAKEILIISKRKENFRKNNANSEEKMPIKAFF